MTTSFHDLSFSENKDFIGVNDRRETVSYDQCCPFLGNLTQGFLDFLLRVRIQGRGGLIKNQNAWALENGSGNRNPLFFSSRELQTTFAHLSFIALGQTLHKAMDLGQLSGFLHLLPRCLWVPIVNVVGNRVVEQHRILGNYADRFAQAQLADISDILPIDSDSPLIDIIKTEQES